VKVKSLDGITSANIYMQGKFTCVIPMPNKMGPKCANSLIEFTNNVGILDELISNGAGEFTGRQSLLTTVVICIFTQQALSWGGRTRTLLRAKLVSCHSGNSR
jgi:hypothetical protein